MSLDFTRILDPADPDLPTGIRTESGLRTRDASALREHLTPYLADYGITRVAHLTGFDYLGLPVHMAVKPQGKSLSSGSGKGPTPDASWVSAVMECAEQAIWEELRPEMITGSESMMRRLGVTVSSGADLPMLQGALWSEHLPVNWTCGWDIVAGEEVWVPENLVTVLTPADGGLRPFVAGSNGLASGAHILEAVLSGLQEVVERDGICIRTMVESTPHMLAGSLLRESAPDIAEKVEASGLLLEVVDATTEIGVPTVVAYLHEQVGGTTGSFKGAGAGVSMRTALTRAVTEAAQARCLIVAGARDDIFETNRTTSQAVSQRTPLSAPQLVDGVDHGTGDVMGDLEWMVGKVVAAGFPRVIVIRHTPPTDPVQVARVIVPGLEGYMFSYAAFGKRAMQWTAQAGQESA